MQLTNRDDLPLSIAVWLATDNYDHNRYPGQFHMSATGLLKPIRQAILGQRNREIAERIPRDVTDKIPSVLGNAIHSDIEAAWVNNYKSALRTLGYSEKVIRKIQVNPDEPIDEIIPIYIEQRFAKKLNELLPEGAPPCIIDGCPDFIGDGVLEDFKSTGVYSYIKGNNDDNYIKQGSIYRWLAPDIITSDFIRINQIFTDWSKLDSIIKKKTGYPQSRIIPKTLELLSIEETENFIKQQVRNLRNYINLPEEELPRCTDEELWRDKTIYKFYGKTGNSKATAVRDTYAEIHEIFMKKGATGIIKEFPGKIKRCPYCDGKDLCTQKDEYLANGTLTL